MILVVVIGGIGGLCLLSWSQALPVSPCCNTFSPEINGCNVGNKLGDSSSQPKPQTLNLVTFIDKYLSRGNDNSCISCGSHDS